MVSRKVLKENLTDSLKLNRARLAQHAADDGAAARDEEWVEDEVSASVRESKFDDASVDADENADAGNRRRRGECGESGLRKQQPVLALGSARSRASKSSRLLEYLDEAKERAEGERERTLESGGAALRSARSARYDWEVQGEDVSDDRSCFEGALAPLASDSPAALRSAAPVVVRGAAHPPPHGSGVGATTSAVAANGPALTSRSSSSSTSATSNCSSAGSGGAVLTMRFELEEKSKTIEALRRALDKARGAAEEARVRVEAEAKGACDRQRSEHEQAVQRHLAFIDKLLADKKQLAGKVEEMSQRMRQSDEAVAKAARDNEVRHAAELARAKEAMAQLDAQKRAKWQKDKCKELKELTIKGLEPEVQSILAKHKEDLRVVEDRFKDEVRAIRDAHDKETARLASELRSRHAIDLEETRSKERTALAAKLREQEQRHRAEAEEQRARSAGEFEDLRRRHREELVEVQALSRERTAEAATVREQALEAHKTQLEAQLAQLESKWAAEREQWQSQVARKYEAQAQADELRLREKLTAARDKQIDAVIGKLCAEQEGKLAELAAQHRRELHDAAQRGEAALADARAAAGDWEQRYLRLKEAHAQEKKTVGSAEQRVRELEQQAERREQRIVELSKRVGAINDQLAEREQAVRAEYAERHAAGLKDAARAAEMLADARSELQRAVAARKQELANHRQAFEEETEEIHRRVRVTVSRKDETIQALRLQVEELRANTESLQLLLDKQRQEFIG